MTRAGARAVGFQVMALVSGTFRRAHAFMLATRPPAVPPLGTELCVTHAWGRPERLPHGGTTQQCSVCLAWRMLGMDDTETVLPQANLDRALAMMRAEGEIDALPEVPAGPAA